MEIKMEREATTSTWGSFKMSVWHVMKKMAWKFPFLIFTNANQAPTYVGTPFCRVDVLCIPGQKSKNPTLLRGVRRYGLDVLYIAKDTAAVNRDTRSDRFLI